MFTTVKRTCWTSRSMLRPRPRWVPLALAMVMATAVGGCGAGAQPPEAPAAAQESAPVDDNAVLAKRIGELPDLGSVYGALPPSVTTTLEKQIAALNDADRATLLDPEGVIARLRPLLSVVGGGGSPLALRALAFSPAAARELAEQAPGTLPVGASSWGPVVNQVSRRAARQLLARERLDYDREGEWSASQIDRVRRCAALLGQWELVDSAMALQLKNEPSMAHRLQAARRARRCAACLGPVRRHHVPLLPVSSFNHLCGSPSGGWLAAEPSRTWRIEIIRTRRVLATSFDNVHLRRLH